MKWTLVAPATIVEFADSDEPSVRQLAEHVPLGVLTLAATLRADGYAVDVVDLNQLLVEHRRQHAHESFAEAVADRLDAAAGPIGFGTLSSSYPLTLRIATAVRDRCRDATLLLGGPQASVVDVATLRAFPAVDLILRGEADLSIRELARALEGRARLDEVRGLTFRRGDAPVQTAPADLPLDLDAVPLPAYDLFPALRQASFIPLEVGRGCPYGCTFCSTNTFFRRRFRLKSPARIVAQMRELASRYGIRQFDFVHDMLTVVRQEVVALCEALIADGAGYTWSCSARTDRVDDQLFDLMHAAGCRGIFFGVETGSPELQRTLKKRLPLADAAERVAGASQRGFAVVVSLITGFPDETEPDLARTVHVFVRSLRYPSVSPQLHLLAPLAGSPIHAQYRDALYFDDVVSDMSNARWTDAAGERALILLHRDVFPQFYAVPTALDRRRLADLRRFLLETANSFRWLLVALHQREHALHAFDAFCDAWRKPNGAGWPLDGRSFRHALLDWVAPRHATPAIAALVAAYRAAESIRVPQAPSGTAMTDERERFPRRAPSVAMAETSADVAEVVRALAADRVPDDVACTRVAAVCAKPDGGLDLMSLPPLAATVLHLCDGTRSVDEIARALPAGEVRRHRTTRTRLCRAVIAQLAERHLITSATVA